MELIKEASHELQQWLAKGLSRMVSKTTVSDTRPPSHLVRVEGGGGLSAAREQTSPNVQQVSREQILIDASGLANSLVNQGHARAARTELGQATDSLCILCRLCVNVRLLTPKTQSVLQA